jgi:hypothetical protein
MISLIFSIPKKIGGPKFPDEIIVIGLAALIMIALL